VIEDGNGDGGVPDVLALEVEEARSRLKAAGFEEVRVEVTGPPWPGEARGEKRVLRQKVAEDGVVELVVAHVKYKKTR
jgi:hypothetical protein